MAAAHRDDLGLVFGAVEELGAVSSANVEANVGAEHVAEIALLDPTGVVLGVNHNSPPGATARWSMFARLPGTRRSWRMTTRSLAKLLSLAPSASSPTAPFLQERTLWGSSLTARSTCRAADGG